ncbi:MAG: ribosome maturation factor RimM [Dehalococcoidia bacterium]
MPKQRVKREEAAIQDDLVTVGRVLAAFGLHGEVKVEVLTDFPQRFAPQSQVLIQGSPMTIEGSRWHKGKMLVKLAGVDNREQAEGLEGVGIEITPEQVPPLPEDHYYHFQVIGLEVLTSQGEPLGQIASVLTTGSNDVYVVNGPRGEVLIPAIEDVIMSVDIARGRMVVEPVKGLL